jgi:hypothetical protein
MQRVPRSLSEEIDLSYKTVISKEIMRSLLYSFLLVSFLALSALAKEKPLQINFLDVEGGQATLLVAPSGKSMLVDTGWPGFNDRDAIRIAGAANASGLKQLDYVSDYALPHRSCRRRATTPQTHQGR